MRERITAARLYFVAPFSLAAGDLPELVPQLVAAGVGVIQLREKEMEAGEMLDKGDVVARVCEACGVPFVVNDRVDVAGALRRQGLDVGVHVGQDDIPAIEARAQLGDDAIVGLSTHSPAEVARASELKGVVDYIAVGPVYETPTKPGRPAAGLSLVQYAARETVLPWFAIGGIDRTNLDEVKAAGAARVVVVRAIALADDPVHAARELSAHLAR